MSMRQCAEAVVQVFPDTPIHTQRGTYGLQAVMVAIAGPQSNYQARANGDYIGEPHCPGCVPPGCWGHGLAGYRRYTSWGYFQIHNSTQPYLRHVTHSDQACDWARWLYNPVHNAQAAYWLYQHQGLDVAWGGAQGNWQFAQVLALLPQAQQMVRQVTATAQTTTPTPHTPHTPRSTPTTLPSPPPLLWIPWALMGLGAVAGLLDLAEIHDQATGHWW